MAGKGLVGGILSSLGDSQSPDIQSRPLSQIAEPLYNDLFRDYGKTGKSALADLDTFRTQFSALTPQLSALDQQHSGIYGDLISQARNYNPGNLQSSGDYLFGKLDNYLKQGLDYGRANQNRALAFAGYGDRAPSAYSTILDSSRIAGNMLPAFSGIVNALPTLNAQSQNAYFTNLANIPAFMRGQTESLQATPYRALVPSQMERANLMANLDSLNKINAGNLSNRYFYEKPNLLQTLGGAFTAAYEGLGDAMDTASKAASTYGNLMTSGLGGQMGLGKSSTPPPSDFGRNNSPVNIGDVEMPGQGTGENYPMSAANMGYNQPPSYYPSGGAYGPVGMGGYSQYNPNSLYSQFYSQQSPYF